MRFPLAISTLCAVILLAIAATPAVAGKPKLDQSTCEQLQTEQIKFIENGILADLQRGPEWASSNLSAERLREVQHYIMLEEQLKFGCRQIADTAETAKAAEIAKRLELNSDADPFKPQKKKPEKKSVTTDKKAEKKDAKPSKADAKPMTPPPAAKPAPAAPQKNSAAQAKQGWNAEVKQKKLPKEADAAPPTTSSALKDRWPYNEW